MLSLSLFVAPSLFLFLSGSASPPPYPPAAAAVSVTLQCYLFLRQKASPVDGGTNRDRNLRRDGEGASSHNLTVKSRSHQVSKSTSCQKVSLTSKSKILNIVLLSKNLTMISRKYSFIAAATLVSFTVAVNSAITISVDTDKALFATDEKFLSVGCFLISRLLNQYPKFTIFLGCHRLGCHRRTVEELRLPFPRSSVHGQGSRARVPEGRRYSRGPSDLQREGIGQEREVLA